MRARLRNPRQSGSILITVLLIVAVLSALAVAVLDDINFAIRRAANVDARSQAQFYAVGAETFAKQLINRARTLSPDRTLRAEWMDKPAVFNLDDGLIEARIGDASNCFNVNSLVGGEGGRNREANETRVGYFTALLVAIGVSEGEAEALANAATDWIDSDGTPRTRGAEDYHYAGLDPPYRTANTLIAEVAELRAVRGFDPATYALVRPFLCAHPSADFSYININTLTERDAPLLVMVAGAETLRVDEARTIIRRRPADGYRSVEGFWAEDGFAGKVPNEERRALVSLKTEYYDLRVQVAYLQAFVEQTSLLSLTATGDIGVVSRRYGAAE